MKKGNYSQDKRQRESEKARKKRAKAERRSQQREQSSSAVEIVTAEDVVGRLPTSTEALLAMEERAKKPLPAASIPSRLFVGSLSWDTTEEALHTLFSQYGEVTDVVILSDRDTGRSRGFGFVTFSDRKEGTRAVEQLDGWELDGRNIVVHVATGRNR